MQENPRPRADVVKEMFSAIAGRYDLLNHLLSVNIDRVWRKNCVKEIAKRVQVQKPRILDVGCGTGDFSLLFSRLGDVIGCDFCHPMLVICRNKVSRACSNHRIDLFEGDALKLPLPDSSFDVVVSAFVLRNLASIDGGLEEMRRVLRPRGVVGILEFALPRNPLISPLFRLYFTRVLPRLGEAISGVEGPYRYLPESVRSFPPPEKLSFLIERAGFDQPSFRRYSGGIAVLHLAFKRH